MNPLYAVIAAIVYSAVLGVTTYHFGRLSVEVPVEKAEVKQAQGEVQQEAKQLTTNSQAEATHDDDLKTINLTVTRTPIIVRSSACPVPDRAAPADSHPASGPVNPGSGRDRDIRPQIDAFERRWETVLADCRRLQAEWPK